MQALQFIFSRYSHSPQSMPQRDSTIFRPPSILFRIATRSVRQKQQGRGVLLRLAERRLTVYSKA
ncbi:MAG: hypothetical protein LBH94_07150, partial [Deltaproteobacteria bacterium]|nr:hypothetical protein [Deltaproteobacteria bacterium]